MRRSWSSTKIGGMRRKSVPIETEPSNTNASTVETHPELKALSKVTKALRGVPPDGQVRVLEYVRHCVSPDAHGEWVDT